jgi:ubiquinone biosynthesis protein UbiJ
LRQQNALDSGHSTIEAAVSHVRDDLSSLLAADESVNRPERELTEFPAEIRSVRSGMEALLEGPSRRVALRCKQ